MTILSLAEQTENYKEFFVWDLHAPDSKESMDQLFAQLGTFEPYCTWFSLFVGLTQSNDSYYILTTDELEEHLVAFDDDSAAMLEQMHTGTYVFTRPDDYDSQILFALAVARERGLIELPECQIFIRIWW